MQAVKGKGTKLERRLAAMLAGMHIRGWRKNAQDIPGNPDIVFDAEQLAIFADGCFWHGCPVCNRKLPQTNKDYWERKIRRNEERALIATQKLTDDGWIVIRIWEHEFKQPEAMALIKTRIRDALARTTDATATDATATVPRVS